MISIIVSTFGSPQWEERGRQTASKVPPGVEVLWVHGDTLAGARNEGARLATREWLCFLDADDELDPDYVERMLDVLPSYDALIQPATLFLTNGIPVSSAELITPHDSLSAGNWMVIGTLIRREQFLALGGFDGSLPIYEDWDLWIRAWQDGAILMQQPEAIYIVHRSVDSRNNQDTQTQIHYFNLIRDRYFPE